VLTLKLSGKVVNERQELSMSIFKRGDVYWFEFVRNGQRYRKSTGVSSQRTARDIEAAFKTALAKGEVGIIERKRAPHFRAALAEFLTWSEEEHRAHKSTTRRYSVSAVALLRYFHETPLDKITPDDVERFKTQRATECKTVRGCRKRIATTERVRPATVNRELACLKAVFNFAIKSDRVTKNPVSRVKFLTENNQQTRVLSYTEQHRYLSNATPLLRDVAVLILETGMRPEEVYTIQPKNVDLTRGLLLIPNGKTAAARRRIKLTSIAWNVLRHRIEGLQTLYLFPCETNPNRPVPKVNNAHDRALKASGVPAFRLYDLRHTWATRAAMSGIDLVTLAAMLGHSRIQMVLRYAHPTQEHQMKAMEKLEAFNALQQIGEFEGESGRVRYS
jgi:integrase